MKAKKFNLREVLIFLAGAEFFHTVSHIVLTYMVAFPWKTKHLLVTQSFNEMAIVLNALITIVLLVWASNIKKR